MASSSGSPCAACKFLRRKCTSECVFSPYFPPDQPLKFANVHKIFGASNISKLLNELLPHQREDAVNSLAYEADARVKDPVYGCVGAISVLQRQVAQLQQELGVAQSDLARVTQLNHTHLAHHPQHHPQHHQQQQHQSQQLGLDLNANLHGQYMGVPHNPWLDASYTSPSPGGAPPQNYELLVMQGEFGSSPTRSAIMDESGGRRNSTPV